MTEVHSHPAFNSAPHDAQWQRPGVGTGTSEASTLWADYLLCWCGKTKPLSREEVKP